MDSEHRIALQPTGPATFELDTDRQHGFLVVRPFTVRILDAQGRPVPRLLVIMTPPGRDATGRVTDDDGIARLHDTVMQGSVELEVDGVAPREGEPPRRPVEVEDAVPYDGGPVSVPGDRPATLQLPPRVMRVRLVGMLFETDKAFLLPSALPGIRRLRTLYDAQQSLAALVVGHTDATGADAYNHTLSEQRALAVAAYLRDDVDDWLGRYAAPPAGKAFGIREDKHMLSHLRDADGEPFYRGVIDDVSWDEATKDAVRRFQASANAIEGAGLEEDGVLGPKTRRPLVTRYMAEDGTTLPAEATLETHGCGEHHPVEPTADGVASAPNRRTEVFFFEHEVTPPVPTGGGEPCSEYPQWVASATSTIDVGDGEPRLVASDWEI